ncbi:MAG: hypothetical protein ACPIOQ_02675 [Promethearchaeia archaeon]
MQLSSSAHLEPHAAEGHLPRAQEKCRPLRCVCSQGQAAAADTLGTQSCKGIKIEVSPSIDAVAVALEDIVVICGCLTGGA